MKRHSPRTLDESVGIILDILTTEQKEKLKSCSEPELGDFHFTLGQWIRNNFIYNNENSWELEQSIIDNPDDYLFAHPDDISGLIVKAVWKALQRGNKTA